MTDNASDLGTIEIYLYSGDVYKFPDASELTFFDEYIEFLYKTEDAPSPRKALFFINNIIGFTSTAIIDPSPKLREV